jgi:hypothetical protein
MCTVLLRFDRVGSGAQPGPPWQRSPLGPTPIRGAVNAKGKPYNCIRLACADSIAFEATVGPTSDVAATLTEMGRA